MNAKPWHVDVHVDNPKQDLRLNECFDIAENQANCTDITLKGMVT